MLSTRFHLVLMVSSEFLGFLLGAAAVALLWLSGLLGGRIWLVAIVALPIFLVTTMIPRIVFQKLLYARCKRNDCNGRAYVTDTKPYTYVCQECGFRHETNVADGEGRAGHRY